MISFIPYTAANAADVIQLWNESLGKSFPMDWRLWTQNVDTCPDLLSSACWMAFHENQAVGCVISKRPNRISLLIVAPLFRRRGIGSALLDHAEAEFTAGESDTIVIAQDERHFFPGVPSELGDAQAFFTSCGYQKGEGLAFDVYRSLDEYRPLVSDSERQDKFAEYGISFRSCARENVPALIAFLQLTFPGRWLRDTKTRLEVESQPSEVKIAILDQGDVVGFAHTWSSASTYIGSPIYWRGLFDRPLGGLGPIGVAQSHRKIGLGLALLDYSVSRVAEEGAKDMVIDWTDLVAFYGRVGFKPWKRYLSYRKTYPSQS